MPRNFDEDSGRSSCSAISIGVGQEMNCQNQVSESYNIKRHLKEASTNTDLKVSIHPRSCISILKSPDEKDPFPSCRILRNHRKAVSQLFDNQRLGGLSNAHSTLNIACSTQIEEPHIKTSAVSMSALLSEHNKNSNIPERAINSNFKRGKPVQRAASRLYRADCSLKGREGCTGPEFIVRASQPAKSMDLRLSSNADRKIVNVVLLNGQRVEVTCDPQIITAGQLFEALVHSEKYEHNFMLGIAILLGGDFVFLPDDYKIKKIAPESWHKNSSKKSKAVEEDILTVFLRIKFFLPKSISNGIQGGEWRHRVYLQLRRATVEGQLTSTIQNLILLAGYALHIEFGEFSYREHGSADYFLLEHYLPENVITNDMADIKLRMKRAHESRHGLDKNKAIINFITLAQTFRDYGAHFYSAIWSTRDGFCRDVWLSIGPRGVTLYSRSNNIVEDSGTTNRIVLQSLPWHHIHTFYYNKKTLYIMPNSYSGLAKIGIKYKLKMGDNKTYFTFWLASLHHRLYLKLYAKEDFITYLSDELSCPINKDASPMKIECSNYQDSYNLAVRNPVRPRRPVRRRFKIDLFCDKKLQNKENEKPNTEELLRQILSPQQSEDSILNANNQGNSSNDGLSSSESCSLPRRQGVKMGTRVFHGLKSVNRYPRSSIVTSSNDCLKSDEFTTTQSDSDDLSSEQKQHCNINSMKLLPERHYAQDMSNIVTAYVLESPKVYPDVFNYNATANDSCLNTTLFEKLDNMECVQAERVFVTAVIERDEMNALGLQVAEGTDGNVYIRSITAGSPADLCKKFIPGDQIISVNGKTLLNIKYDKALEMLQSAPKAVELIVLQNTNKSHNLECKVDEIEPLIKKSICNSLASALDTEITDDELINEEALKTIYALIKLTKDKVVSRMKDKSSQQSTPTKSNLHKCHSENKVYEESDAGQYSSQENTPQKKNSQKFNTWRGHLNSSKSKRRPLSLSIPTDVNVSESYLDDSEESLTKRSSLKSIQSSLNSLDKIKSSSAKNVALPRNFGLSRKWLGPVKYPVTPCKNGNVVQLSDSSAIDNYVMRKHFVYGVGDSDEEQIFL